MRVFLPWTSPMLPAAACRLLEEGGAEADLGGLLVVVRGRNTGRRLLAQLALEAQRHGRALVPPRIVTPGALEAALFPGEEMGAAVAGRLAQRLAWTLALGRADAAMLEAIWRTPGGREPRQSAWALGGVLDRTWRELAASGRDFEGAFALLEKMAPEEAIAGEARWHGLSRLLEAYREILRAWGMSDPADWAQARLRREALPAGATRRAVLVGMVEIAPVALRLLRQLPEEPLVLVHAPESEAAGFDEWGRLVPPYWVEKPCRFVEGEIHPVADAGRQAARCAELVAAWREAGLPGSAITIAVPEAEALPGLEQELEDRGLAVRRAEGHPASRTAPVQLLAALAACLEGGEPPLFSAVADLVRHPDLEAFFGGGARRLDRYFGEHLPWRLEVEQEQGAPEAMVALQERMAPWTSWTSLASVRAGSFVEAVTERLLEVYGERRADRHDPEGRLLFHALEAIRDAFDEIRALPAEALDDFSPADLLKAVVETAGQTGIPLPEQPEAVELAGWLEAAADDAPGLIVTSVFEGSLPEGAPPEPLLHDGLRERLGLPCRASRFARDQVTLWAARESRRGRGRLALLAPRRDAGGNPTRPSRLLVNGHRGAELATRLLALTSPPPPLPAARGTAEAGSGFPPPQPDPERMRALRTFSVTGFRTYLASPRLFYFKHILRLRAETDDAGELDAAGFGTVIHAVLQRFGERCLERGAEASPPEEQAMREELDQLLAEQMSRQFGRYPLPFVSGQYWAIRERLAAFAARQAALFAEGWRIACVEGSDGLEVAWEIPGREALSGVQLRGRIDRIDRHPDGRWRVMDYKTASIARKPLAAHYSENKKRWKDLQLPLYVKLLSAVTLPGGGAVDPDPDKLELVYFNLPPRADDAGVSEPFPNKLLPGAWEQAEAIAAEVCSGEGCREAGKVSSLEDPVFLALCGLNGLPETGEEEEE